MCAFASYIKIVLKCNRVCMRVRKRVKNPRVFERLLKLVRVRLCECARACVSACMCA